MIDNLEVAGPFLALLAGIEEAREQDALGERAFFIGGHQVVQDDVVDYQLRLRIGVELDVIDALATRASC